MASDLSSEMKVRFSSGGIPNIAARNAHVIGIAGVTERGPFGARLVSSWAEYLKTYGGFTANADVALAVWNCFAERGDASPELYINRIVHRNGDVAASAAATVMLRSGGVGTFLFDTLKVDGKTHGSYANSIKIRVADATNGEAACFDLKVELSGVVVEHWKNLTMDSTDAVSYVETVINHATAGSDYIAVTDQDVLVAALQKRPVNGLSAYMASGDDGLSGLVDLDYTGSKTAGIGLYAFDALQTLDILIVPGRATTTVQNALVTYCETDWGGQTLAILDPAASQTAAQMVTYWVTTASLYGLSFKIAMYWPRPRITNPDPVTFGTGLSISVPPSGLLAGLCARVAAESPKGKFTQPAGISWPLRSVVGFEGEDDERKQPHAVCQKTTRNLVFPKRINPLRKDKVGPYYVDGELTAKRGTSKDFATVGEQLGAQYVAKEVEQGLDIVRHMDNDEVTREQARQVVDMFLRPQCAAGCFKSKDPATAYVVDFGAGLNTPDVVRQNKLKGYIGLATNDPILYGDIEIAKDTRAYDASVAP